MKVITLFLVLLLPFSLHSQPITFSDAWQQLQQQSYKLKAQDQEVIRAKAEQGAADDLNLPSLSLNGSYTHLADPFEMDLTGVKHAIGGVLPPITAGIANGLPSALPFTEQDVFRASLKVMWPIYTGGKISAAQSIKLAQVTEKKQSLEIAKRELFKLLVDRYFAVTLTKNVLETQKQVIDALEKHLHHAIKLEQQGQIAHVEKLNAEVAVANGKVKLGRITRQYQMAQIALNRMLNAHNLQPTSPIFLLKETPSLPFLSEIISKQHPALGLLQAKEAQANGLMGLEKSNYFPKVFLYGNYTLYEDDSVLANVEPDWFVGVGVSMPIFSNDGRSDKVKGAKSALMQVQFLKAQTQQDLSLLLDQTYRQLQQAQEEVSALNLSFKLAKENVRLRTLAFNQGLSTSVDLVDAELKLSGVKTQQLMAKYHYIQSYASLMALSGQLNEFIERTELINHQQKSLANIQSLGDNNAD